MFERIVAQYTSDERYLDIAAASVVFTFLSIILVQHVMPFRVGGTDFGGLMAVLLTSLAVAYPFVKYLVKEERQEVVNRWSEKRLIRRHSKELELYLTFFLGTTVAFAVSTFFVPDGFYNIQMQVLSDIGAPTGQILGDPFFLRVLENNAWVFMVTFVMTFFVSSAVIFVLAWNASVLGVFIGDISAELIHVPIETLPYLPHGMLEIGGYILAGIAGALLSYEVEIIMLEGQDGVNVSRIITRDVIVLLAWGMLFVVLGAFIEAV